MAKPVSEAAQKLGARVRERRQELGLSQEALARETGLHWTFVGQVERGQRNLNLHNLLRLAQGLGVDAGDLVTGLRPPESR
jgi:transcriptional regulator with XRE-family HTH domain